MNSIVDNIFIDNLHIMFGEDYLLNTVNTIFLDMAPEYRLAMNTRLYQEVNKNNKDIEDSNDNILRAEKQKKLILDYLSNLLREFFKKIQNNITKGGAKYNSTDKLEKVKNYIRDKVSNIKPKFYT